MGDEDTRCDHPRLVRIVFKGPPLPMFGNVFQCEMCKDLVEVVIGRTITTQQLRDFANAIETGEAKPSIPPPSIDLDEADIVAVEIGDDTWGNDG